MRWITPKTDWVSEDYFNIEDYNRIATNLKYIKNMARIVSDRMIYFEEMGSKDSYNDMLEPIEVNNFQTNLRRVNEKTAHFNLGSDTIYEKGGFTPNQIQWNRIEGFTLQIHDYCKDRTTTTRLTQKLGNTDSRRGLRL